MQAGKRGLVFAAMVAVALGLAATASGGAESISVTDAGGDTFAPDVVTTSVGAGGVIWQWDPNNDTESEGHNVVQDNGLFKSGPLMPVDDNFQLDPSAGTFLYYCEAHGDKGGSGMSGELRIAPLKVATKSKGPGIEIGVRWAETSLDTGDRFDVDYRVGNGDWKQWRRDASKTEGSFGKNNNPVDVKPGRAYSFRVRSKDSSNLKRKRSGWSPKLVVDA